MSQEIEEQRVWGTVLPVIFLAVAAFILNVVLHRQVYAQRGEIAALKALGYDDRAIAWHYLGFASVIVLLGAAIGLGVGDWLGRAMTGLLSDFFHFPTFEFRVLPGVALGGMGILDGNREGMLAAISQAHRAGKFVYAMKSLAGGNFVPNREEALRFIFGNADLDAVVVGMVTPQEVEWNVRFASGQPIPAELSEKTALLSKRLNIVALACEGCGECVEKCENGALSVVDGKAVVDHERCILCGYCAPHCQRLAIRMV